MSSRAACAVVVSAPLFSPATRDDSAAGLLGFAGFPLNDRVRVDDRDGPANWPVHIALSPDQCGGQTEGCLGPPDPPALARPPAPANPAPGEGAPKPPGPTPHAPRAAQGDAAAATGGSA